ncbi:hypothetical protein RHMOL_Rhmol04G0109400 [Rhododendron molle]|uniref:Uncharacterized protein n=1 Tax=Rhododendron molle TaxID=49168 RepID=A0ACC0P1G8_RHOML|nr:hypothetical protein RHMOL_Rhmol04G0109400 [Rhododendron molle]
MTGGGWYGGARDGGGSEELSPSLDHLAQPNEYGRLASSSLPKNRSPTAFDESDLLAPAKQLLYFEIFRRRQTPHLTVAILSLTDMVVVLVVAVVGCGQIRAKPLPFLATVYI